MDFFILSIYLFILFHSSFFFRKSTLKKKESQKTLLFNTFDKESTRQNYLKINEIY